MNFFQLPIGAGPNDPVVGEVDGAQIRRAPNGTKYYSQYRAPAAPAQPSMMTETTLDEQGRAIHNRVPNTTRDQVRAILAGPSAIAGEAVRGLTAPGRALRGEPVTYGDAWATALDYGVGSAPTSAPEGALRSGGIKAYHGSPHDFDRFSMDKIGTGEGAQAYGHGLYFAESEDVARSYRDSLAQQIDVDGKPIVSNNRRVGSTGDQDVDDALSAHNGDLEAAIADEAAFADEMEAAGKTSRRFGGDPRTLQRKLEALRGRVGSENTGHMYEVNINANPDDFLDWDAPLSEQPEKVRRAVDGPLRDYLRSAYDGQIGNFERREAGDVLGEMSRNQVRQAEQLREAGIPGIKYKDGMSRGAEGGTRNFVVFDEDLISIVRKYGIAGAAAYLGMPEDEIRQRVGGA